MSIKICTCTPGKDVCDDKCLYGGNKLPRYIWIGLIVLLILVGIVSASSQTPVMYGGGTIEEFLPESDKHTYQPSIWKYADCFEGADVYVVHREAHKTGNKTYLLGLDANGEESMRILIDYAQLSVNMTYCIVSYNGWEIRLRGKLN
jgi:hypothetical protein